MSTNAKSLVKKAGQLKKSIEQQQVELNRVKAKLQGHFDTSIDIKALEAESYIASKRERVDIKYLPEKLKANLDKEIFAEVTDRNYYIKDIDALVRLLKKAGIKPKQFKKLVDADVAVNKDKLKQLYEIGEITKEDLKGCYEAKIIKWIDIRERKGDETD